MAKSNYNYDFWAKEFEYKEGGMKDRALTNQAIDRAAAERRLLTDRTRAEQDRQLKRSITNYNFGKAIADDMDDLNVVANSGAVGMDQIIQQGSRELADAAGALTAELTRSGDYNAYAAGMSNIKAQVTEMKNLEADATAYMGLFNEMSENDAMSNYVSADLRAATMAMQNGNGAFGMKDGVLTWSGETVTGEPYNIAASEFKNLKNKLVGKTNVNGTINNAMKVQTTPSGNILSFDQAPTAEDGSRGLSARDFAENSLKDTIDSRGAENRHRMVGALLTDNFGYTEQQAKLLLAEDYEKAYNVLEKEWIDQAQSQYGINQKAVNTEKRAQADQYEQHKLVRDKRRNIKNNQQELPALWDNKEDAVWKNPGAYFDLEEKDKAAFVEKARADIIATGATDLTEITRPTDEIGVIEVVGFKAQNPNSRIKKPVTLMFEGSTEDWGNAIFTTNDLDPYKWQELFTGQKLNKKTGLYESQFRRKDSQLNRDAQGVRLP